DFRARIASARLVAPGPGDQQLYPADNRGWAGRFGFSYSPTTGGRTVVRGSYGIFYDRPFDNLWQNLRVNNLSLGVFAVNSFPVNFLAPVAGTLPAYRNQPVDTSFPWLTMFQGDLKNAYMHSYFFGMQRQLPGEWAVEANTLGSLGRRLITTDVVN